MNAILQKEEHLSPDLEVLGELVDQLTELAMVDRTEKLTSQESAFSAQVVMELVTAVSAEHFVVDIVQDVVAVGMMLADVIHGGCKMVEAEGGH